MTRRFSLKAEYLYGTNEMVDDRSHWSGVAVIGDYDLSERWRLFSRYSYLDDPDGFTLTGGDRQHEVGVGAAFDLHPDVEARFEYRHDFADVSDDEDSVFAHMSFGF